MRLTHREIFAGIRCYVSTVSPYVPAYFGSGGEMPLMLCVVYLRRLLIGRFRIASPLSRKLRLDDPVFKTCQSSTTLAILAVPWREPMY